MRDYKFTSQRYESLINIIIYCLKLLMLNGLIGILLHVKVKSDIGGKR
jgi:hypothetical protein